MNCVALVRHFSSLGQAPGLSSFKGIRCTVVLRWAVAVDDCRDERTVNASVPPMPGDGNPKLWDQPLNVARGPT